MLSCERMFWVKLPLIAKQGKHWEVALGQLCYVFPMLFVTLNSMHDMWTSWFLLGPGVEVGLTPNIMIKY
jgi:hypothetical protein